jgi:hypothetical protein
MLKNSDEVSFFVSRVTYANSDTPENYRTMAEELSKATALIIPENRLDVIAYGCTAATVEFILDIYFILSPLFRPEPKIYLGRLKIRPESKIYLGHLKIRPESKIYLGHLKIRPESKIYLGRLKIRPESKIYLGHLKIRPESKIYLGRQYNELRG